METLECIHNFLTAGIFVLFCLICVLVNKCCMLYGGGDGIKCTCRQDEILGEITPSNNVILREPGKPPRKLPLYQFLEGDTVERSASCERCCVGVNTDEKHNAGINTDGHYSSTVSTKGQQSDGDSETSGESDIVEHTVRVKVRLSEDGDSTRVETPSGTKITVGPSRRTAPEDNERSIPSALSRTVKTDTRLAPDGTSSGRRQDYDNDYGQPGILTTRSNDSELIRKRKIQPLGTDSGTYPPSMVRSDGIRSRSPHDNDYGPSGFSTKHVSPLGADSSTYPPSQLVRGRGAVSPDDESARPEDNERSIPSAPSRTVKTDTRLAPDGTSSGRRQDPAAQGYDNDYGQPGILTTRSNDSEFIRKRKIQPLGTDSGTYPSSMVRSDGIRSRSPHDNDYGPSGFSTKHVRPLGADSGTYPPSQLVRGRGAVSPDDESARPEDNERSIPSAPFRTVKTDTRLAPDGTSSGRRQDPAAQGYDNDYGQPGILTTRSNDSELIRKRKIQPLGTDSGTYPSSMVRSDGIRSRSPHDNDYGPSGFSTKHVRPLGADSGTYPPSQLVRGRGAVSPDDESARPEDNERSIPSAPSRTVKTDTRLAPDGTSSGRRQDPAAQGYDNDYGQPGILTTRSNDSELIRKRKIQPPGTDSGTYPPSMVRSDGIRSRSPDDNDYGPSGFSTKHVRPLGADSSTYPPSQLVRGRGAVSPDDESASPRLLKDDSKDESRKDKMDKARGSKDIASVDGKGSAKRSTDKDKKGNKDISAFKGACAIDCSGMKRPLYADKAAKSIPKDKTEKKSDKYRDRSPPGSGGRNSPSGRKSPTDRRYDRGITQTESNKTVPDEQTGASGRSYDKKTNINHPYNSTTTPRYVGLDIPECCIPGSYREPPERASITDRKSPADHRNDNICEPCKRDMGMSPTDSSKTVPDEHRRINGRPYDKQTNIDRPYYSDTAPKPGGEDMPECCIPDSNDKLADIPSSIIDPTIINREPPKKSRITDRKSPADHRNDNICEPCKRDMRDSPTDSNKTVPGERKRSIGRPNYRDRALRPGEANIPECCYSNKTTDIPSDIIDPTVLHKESPEKPRVRDRKSPTERCYNKNGKRISSRLPNRGMSPAGSSKTVPNKKENMDRPYKSATTPIPADMPDCCIPDSGKDTIGSLRKPFKNKPVTYSKDMPPLEKDETRQQYAKMRASIDCGPWCPNMQEQLQKSDDSSRSASKREESSRERPPPSNEDRISGIDHSSYYGELDDTVLIYDKDTGEYRVFDKDAVPVPTDEPESCASICDQMNVPLCQPVRRNISPEDDRGSFISSEDNIVRYPNGNISPRGKRIRSQDPRYIDKDDKPDTSRKRGRRPMSAGDKDALSNRKGRHAEDGVSTAASDFIPNKKTQRVSANYKDSVTVKSSFKPKDYDSNKEHSPGPSHRGPKRSYTQDSENPSDVDQIHGQRDASPRKRPNRSPTNTDKSSPYDENEDIEKQYEKRFGKERKQQVIPCDEECSRNSKPRHRIVDAEEIHPQRKQKYPRGRISIDQSNNKEDVQPGAAPSHPSRTKTVPNDQIFVDSKKVKFPPVTEDDPSKRIEEKNRTKNGSGRQGRRLVADDDSGASQINSTQQLVGQYQRDSPTDRRDGTSGLPTYPIKKDDAITLLYNKYGSPIDIDRPITDKSATSSSTPGTIDNTFTGYVTGSENTISGGGSFPSEEVFSTDFQPIKRDDAITRLYIKYGSPTDIARLTGEKSTPGQWIGDTSLTCSCSESPSKISLEEIDQIIEQSLSYVNRLSNEQSALSNKIAGITDKNTLQPVLRRRKIESEGSWATCISDGKNSDASSKEITQGEDYSPSGEMLGTHSPQSKSKKPKSATSDKKNKRKKGCPCKKKAEESPSIQETDKNIDEPCVCEKRKPSEISDYSQSHGGKDSDTSSEVPEISGQKRKIDFILPDDDETAKLYPKGQEESEPSQSLRGDSTTRPYYTSIGSYISDLSSSKDVSDEDTYSYDEEHLRSPKDKINKNNYPHEAGKTAELTSCCKMVLPPFPNDEDISAENSVQSSDESVSTDEQLSPSTEEISQNVYLNNEALYENDIPENRVPSDSEESIPTNELSDLGLRKWHPYNLENKTIKEEDERSIPSKGSEKSDQPYSDKSISSDDISSDFDRKKKRSGKKAYPYDENKRHEKKRPRSLQHKTSVSVDPYDKENSILSDEVPVSDRGCKYRPDNELERPLLYSNPCCETKSDSRPEVEFAYDEEDILPKNDVISSGSQSKEFIPPDELSDSGRKMKHYPDRESKEPQFYTNPSNDKAAEDVFPLSENSENTVPSNELNDFDFAKWYNRHSRSGTENEQNHLPELVVISDINVYPSDAEDSSIKSDISHIKSTQSYCEECNPSDEAPDFDYEKNIPQRLDNTDDDAKPYFEVINLAPWWGKTPEDRTGGNEHPTDDRDLTSEGSAEEIPLHPGTDDEIPQYCEECIPSDEALDSQKDISSENNIQSEEYISLDEVPDSGYMKMHPQHPDNTDDGTQPYSEVINLAPLWGKTPEDKTRENKHPFDDKYITPKISATGVPLHPGTDAEGTEPYFEIPSLYCEECIPSDEAPDSGYEKNLPQHPDNTDDGAQPYSEVINLAPRWGKRPKDETKDNEYPSDEKDISSEHNVPSEESFPLNEVPDSGYKKTVPQHPDNTDDGTQPYSKVNNHAPLRGETPEDRTGENKYPSDDRNITPETSAEFGDKYRQPRYSDEEGVISCPDCDRGILPESSNFELYTEESIPSDELSDSCDQKRYPRYRDVEGASFRPYPKIPLDSLCTCPVDHSCCPKDKATKDKKSLPSNRVKGSRPYSEESFPTDVLSDSGYSRSYPRDTSPPYLQEVDLDSYQNKRPRHPQDRTAQDPSNEPSDSSGTKKHSRERPRPYSTKSGPSTYQNIRPHRPQAEDAYSHRPHSYESAKPSHRKRPLLEESQPYSKESDLMSPRKNKRSRRSQDRTDQDGYPYGKKDISPGRRVMGTRPYSEESIPSDNISDSVRSKRHPHQPYEDPRPYFEKPICTSPENHPCRPKRKKDKLKLYPYGKARISDESVSSNDEPYKKRRKLNVSSGKKLYSQGDESKPSTSGDDNTSHLNYTNIDPYISVNSSQEDVGTERGVKTYFPSEIVACPACKRTYEERSRGPKFTSESKCREDLPCYQPSKRQTIPFDTKRDLDKDEDEAIYQGLSTPEREKQKEGRAAMLVDIAEKVQSCLSCTQVLNKSMTATNFKMNDYIKCPICVQTVRNMNQNDYNQWKQCYKKNYSIPDYETEAERKIAQSDFSKIFSVKSYRRYRISTNSTSSDDSFKTYKVSSKVTVTSRGKTSIQDITDQDVNPVKRTKSSGPCNKQCPYNASSKRKSTTENISDLEMKPVIRIRAKSCNPSNTPRTYKVTSKITLTSRGISIENLSDSEQMSSNPLLKIRINKENILDQPIKEEPIKIVTKPTQDSKVRICTESTETICVEDSTIRMPCESVTEYLERLRTNNIIPYPSSTLNVTSSSQTLSSSRSRPTNSTIEREYPSSQVSEVLAKYQKSLEENNYNRRLLHRMEAARQSNITARNVIKYFSDGPATSGRADYGQFYPYRLQPPRRPYVQPYSQPATVTTSYPFNCSCNFVCPPRMHYCIPVPFPPPDYNSIVRFYSPAVNPVNNPSVKSIYVRDRKDKYCQKFRSTCIQKRYCNPRDIPSTSRGPDPAPQNRRSNSCRKSNCRGRYQFKK